MDLKEQNLKYLKPRYKAVQESAEMPLKKLNTVVKSVNLMSRQLLDDVKGNDNQQSKDDSPMKQYFQAIAAVTPTGIHSDITAMDYEYQSTDKDSKVLKDIKRIKRR